MSREPNVINLKTKINELDRNFTNERKKLEDETVYSEPLNRSESFFFESGETNSRIDARNREYLNYAEPVLAEQIFNRYRSKEESMIPYGIYHTNGSANQSIVFKGKEGGLFYINKSGRRSYIQYRHNIEPFT